MEFERSLSLELTTYGFLEQKTIRDDGWHEDYFSPRFYRFRFWLEVNDLSNQMAEFEVPQK